MLISTGRTSLAVAGKKVIVGIRFQTSAESAFGMVVQVRQLVESASWWGLSSNAWHPGAPS